MTPWDRFAIGFDQRDRARLHQLWDEVLDSHQWTEGQLVNRFESLWADWNRLGAVAFSSWAGAALAALEFAGVRGETVLCPSNTFMATPLAALKAGGAETTEPKSEEGSPRFAAFKDSEGNWLGLQEVA